jgi:O-acetyl-ADP-ribose deacetylase (regulator of RNase III)
MVATRDGLSNPGGGRRTRQSPIADSLGAMSRTVTIGSVTVSAVQADITSMEVEAVVNAANEHLKHGGGLAAAMVRAGGPEVQEDSDRWISDHGPLRPGVAAATTAGSMPADSVIHVAGPRFREGQDNEGLLRTAVTAALDKAAAEGWRSLALPAISAGMFGYPLGQAARVIAYAVVAWARERGGIDEVFLVGIDPTAALAFDEGLAAAAGS